MSIRNDEMNILCLGAHPDDIEVMAGGALAKWIQRGSTVHAITFTSGVWTTPEGIVMRNQEDTFKEEKNASTYLGYTTENLGFPAMELHYQDRHVVEVLRRIETHNIDTIICPWDRDAHHDHEVVARIAMATSKRIPRILMGQINYYLREVFTPNFFVDITDTWDQKIKSIQFYESEWARAGEDWYEFLDTTTRYYGKMIGVKRAEGFITRKFLF